MRVFRRLIKGGARKNNCRCSGGQSQLTEDTLHPDADGLVVRVERALGFWGLACWPGNFRCVSFALVSPLRCQIRSWRPTGRCFWRSGAKNSPSSNDTATQFHRLHLWGRTWMFGIGRGLALNRRAPGRKTAKPAFVELIAPVAQGRRIPDRVRVLPRPQAAYPMERRFSGQHVGGG
jgi:hypothetical protein